MRVCCIGLYAYLCVDINVLGCMLACVLCWVVNTGTGSRTHIAMNEKLAAMRAARRKCHVTDFMDEGVDSFGENSVGECMF